MRAKPNPVDALVLIPRHPELADRAASFRQAIVALSQSAGVGPPPLDGVEEVVLERAAHIALSDGLADDIDWIGADKAAVALYELTAALPQGRARRELGRRVFARLYTGTAATFSAVAQRMALGSGKPLDSPTLHARVGLVVDMPIGSGVNADALALTLVSRRELHERWVQRPSMGALPARRLAAKLYEHAAREAVVRYQQGDPHAVQSLLSERLRTAFQRLLADREPLVWRHAAIARGLLATVDNDVHDEVNFALDLALSPTEWRRAGVSMVAALAGNSEEVFRGCVNILEGPLSERDPGIAASMVMGLPRVMEAEPDRALQFLSQLARSERPDVAEAIGELLSDSALGDFGLDATKQQREVLETRARQEGSVLRGVAQRALALFERNQETDKTTVRYWVHQALLAFENEGAQAAFEHATTAMVHAHGALDFVEGHDPLGSHEVHLVLGVLAELDASALERSRLSDLLLLGRRPGDTDASIPEMDRLRNRLGAWILRGEAGAGDDSGSQGAALANQRRLKALLHVMDIETAETESGGEGIEERVKYAIVVLLRRLASAPEAMVHRIISAALARSFDAAVREGIAEPSDLVLLVLAYIDDHESVMTIEEASTNVDISGPVRALADFMRPALLDPALQEATDTNTDVDIELTLLEHGGREHCLKAAQRVTQLSQGISAGGSYRGEALRRVMFRLGRSLEATAAARGLAELAESSGSASIVDDIEQSLDSLRKLIAGASRRILDHDPTEISITANVPPLSTLVERAVTGGVPPNREQFAAALEELRVELPASLAACILDALGMVHTLPVAPPSDAMAIPLEKRRVPLPDWLLPRRTIGAFYVVRALGSGGVSSVFVARRIEERHDARAGAFALKVPEYDPTTARSLSEQEFLQLFREEAGALLALPSHVNLARFVTFDLAARPKPILVMELIRGTGLDRLVRNRSLTSDLAFTYLDGILAGLETMHSAGVGHLDVKPSNVILRDSETPVLVDFGLSGRHLRPGCGTLEYCAPEILGVSPEDGFVATPPAADVYAFACTAFELLTGELLFDAGDETQLVSMQVGHDGWPEKLARLAHDPDTKQLWVILAACLRRDPRHRPSARQTRQALSKAVQAVGQLPWPIPAAEVREISA